MNVQSTSSSRGEPIHRSRTLNEEASKQPSSGETLSHPERRQTKKDSNMNANESLNASNEFHVDEQESKEIERNSAILPHALRLTSNQSTNYKRGVDEHRSIE